MVNKVTFAGFRERLPQSNPVIRLVTRESTRIDNKDSERKAQVMLLLPEEN